MSDSVTVIVNVFNEAATIEAEVRALHAAVVVRLPGSEFIVAEDGSTDGTKEILGRLATELGIVHLTSAERKGYARALKDALLAARCPWIFFSDTGGKNEVADFWKLWAERDGADLVLGRRSGRTDQLYRRAMTWGYNGLLRLWFGLRVTDSDSGFRLYRGGPVKAVAAQDWINRDLVGSEIVLRLHAMGATIREVPILYRQRQGESRGLPVKRIPRVIWRVLNNFARLKAECRRLRAGVTRSSA